MLPEGVTGRTRVFGIIGDPVEHSLSPVFWNAGFRSLGIDALYVAFPVRGEACLETAVRGMAALGVAGFNVTRPFKEGVVPCLQKLEPPVDRIGAVNTVRCEPDGRMTGTNTDVAALSAILDGFPDRRSFLVLGTGGAGRAVLGALCHRAGPMVYFTNRSAPRRTYSSPQGSPPPVPIEWEDTLLKEVIANVDVVINCTSLGWSPTDELPALAALDRRHLYLDLNYGAESRLLACAHARGATVVDGLEFLVRQGLAAFSFLTGLPAPERAIRESLAPFSLKGFSSWNR